MKLKKAPSRHQLVREATDDVHLSLLAVAKVNAKTSDPLLRHARAKLSRALGKLSPEQLRVANQEMLKKGWMPRDSYSRDFFLVSLR